MAPRKSGSSGRSKGSLDALAASIRTCRLCRDQPDGAQLPHEPRPVLVLSATARIAICGQAPGTRVHASGRPFSDPSGVRLRSWLGVSDAEFYDPARFVIVPMGFCFPGLSANGSDLPPRRECARTWRAAVFAEMPQLELLLLIGRHAQLWHLGRDARSSMRETVADWQAVRAIPHLSGSGRKQQLWPLPHPSWRNNAWLGKNPWFERDLVPVLQREIRRRV